MLEVAVGGALGTLVRYGLFTAFPVGAERFPWTTLAINLTGSFLLAVLLVRAPHHRRRVGTGFLGGFTTMSAVAVESDLLIGDGRLVTAIAYVAASIAGGLAAVRVVRR